ncbi:MAG: dephospho-CoA kinase [Bacteroidales bacterium]|nr:dephospho-CoA kinase [Bacteroidales bacterium]
MTKYVALTGGIGCGKSVVARLFVCMGVPVYDSDSRAKLLMNSDEEIISSLKSLVGNNVYKDSTLQKDVLAQAIFSDSDLCGQVNAIVHPRVWEDYKSWSDRQDFGFTIMETALLYETDLYKRFDASIAVVASDEIRIQRVMQRDGVSANDVLWRIKKQSSLNKAVQNADFIIENNDTFVIPQVMRVYNTLLTQ